MLALLGLEDRLVGISHECDYPPSITDRPRLTRSLVEASAASCAIDDQVRSLAASGSALYSLDGAELARLRPDVIFTQAQCDVCAVRYEDVLTAVHREPALKDTRVIALNPHSLEDVLADIVRVGEATGKAARAQQVVASLRQRIAAVEVVTQGLRSRA